MPDRPSSAFRRPAVAAAVAVAVLAACSAAAEAHGIKVFASVEDGQICGEAYFVGGGNPRDVDVRLLGPAGNVLARTRTDDKGVFRFTPAVRCDMKIVVETGDGHLAEFAIASADLPESLPALASAPAAGAASAPSAPAAAPAASAPAGKAGHSAAPPAGVDAAELQRLVRQAVRRELDAHERNVNLREIVGGIGYIVGVMGLVALLKRRKGGRERPGTGQDQPRG